MGEELHELVTEVRASRNAVAQGVSRLKEELDLAKKAAAAVRRQPFAWMGGATFGGFLFSRFLFKKRHTKKPKRKKGADKGDGETGRREDGEKGSHRSITLWGFLLAVVRLVFPLLKPVLSGYATSRLTDFLSRK